MMSSDLIIVRHQRHSTCAQANSRHECNDVDDMNKLHRGECSDLENDPFSALPLPWFFDRVFGQVR